MKRNQFSDNFLRAMEDEVASIKEEEMQNLDITVISGHKELEVLHSEIDGNKITVYV